MKKQTKRINKKPRQGQKVQQTPARILGGILLVIVAIFFVCASFSGLDALFFPNPNSSRVLVIAITHSLDGFAMLFLAVLSLVMSATLFMRKKMPAVYYYLFIALLVVATINRSFGPLNMYESRLCDRDVIRSCGIISDEIIMIFLFDIIVYTAGIMVALAIYRSKESRQLKAPKK